MVKRPNAPLPPASDFVTPKLKARFWMKVSPAPSDACWIWHGASNSRGYGNFGIGIGPTGGLPRTVVSDFGRGAPISPGYEISRFEVRAFMAALGLNPVDVDSITIKDKRVIANLLDGESIAIPIKDSRG